MLPPRHRKSRQVVPEKCGPRVGEELILVASKGEPENGREDRRGDDLAAPLIGRIGRDDRDAAEDGEKRTGHQRKRRKAEREIAEQQQYR